MSVLFVLITIVVVCLSYKWYQLREINRKLSWIPNVPGLPILGNTLDFGDTSAMIQTLLDFSNKYGKLFLLNIATVPTIFTTDYEFTAFLLGSRTLLNKSHDYVYLTDWLGTGLLTSSGAKWKERRRLLTPAFHFSILEQYVESFESNGNVLIEKLNQKLDEDINIDQDITLYTLDVICETAMGVEINAQNNRDSQYVNAVQNMCRIVMKKSFSVIARIPFLYRLTNDYAIEQQSLKYLHSVTYSVIDSRLQKLKNAPKNQTETPDDTIGIKKKMAFLDILLKSSIDGASLTREDIREEVDTFMFEGHDTTASAITFILYLLGQHQDIQMQAVKEQKLIFGIDISRKVTNEDLHDMKYLECVIKESLRIYPSVPIFGRYVDEDVYFKGNLVPKGVSITVLPFGIMRDPEYFPDPLKFDPNRFEEGDVRKQPYSFIPFSAGSRNCIGQKFAILEIKSTISKILRNFQILPCPDHEIELVFEVVLKSRNGVKIRLRKRNW